MAKIDVKKNLACSLGQRNEVPNIELAQKIAKAKDAVAVGELVVLLGDKKKDIQNDSIKVLYEIGAIEPSLLRPHLDAFLQLLKSKNNRMVWGAMTAIYTITPLLPSEVYHALPAILEAGELGSVIAKDNVVGILVNLAQTKERYDDAMSLVLEQLINAAHNQFAMYAEKISLVVDSTYKEQFLAILKDRLPELPKDSQKKRVEKLLRKLSQ